MMKTPQQREYEEKMIDMFIEELNKKGKKIMKVEVRNNNVEQALRILKKKNTKRRYH